MVNFCCKLSVPNYSSNLDTETHDGKSLRATVCLSTSPQVALGNSSDIMLILLCFMIKKTLRVAIENSGGSVASRYSVFRQSLKHWWAILNIRFLLAIWQLTFLNDMHVLFKQ